MPPLWRDETDYHAFSPPLLRLQQAPPNPLGSAVIRLAAGLLGALLIWSVLGQLDIVAVANGKLIPHSYLKIVQPADAGIVKEILVREGEVVHAGQVLMRMDTLLTDADARSIAADLERKRLTLRRIDAELRGVDFWREDDDSPALAAEIEAQCHANRQAIDAALAEERSRLAKARAELATAQQVQAKLGAVLPHYREQDAAFTQLAKDGFAGSLMASDKRRERIEKEQELKTQEHLIASASASIAQSEKKLLQLTADYRRQLHSDRQETQGAISKLTEELTKQSHRQLLLELKATQESVVKDLATHTVGTVVQPGTVLLTLVPKDDALRAEVWVSNDDIGFVRPGQSAKLKFAAFPFQKYGMLEGIVEHVSADATEPGADLASSRNDKPPAGSQAPVYKALIRFGSTTLAVGDARLPLGAGMQASAEILLGRRTVAEYLLSPVQKAWHEAARER
ncbi:MAG: HlyD family type I secretion periplasmic adaptor subunit [Elusimicrobia bacterium]|nr:MAG: HlyD family type I secretion periplasmic adaptor subunit [Elusimicrobiota bacterium]